MFETTVANSLEQLQAKPGFLPMFREVVREVWVRKNRSAKEDGEQVSKHIESLRHRQNSLLDRIPLCKTLLVQEKLEDQISELEAAIKSAEKQMCSTGIQEGEIDAYFQIAKKLMEHPKEHVFNAPTKEKLEKLWGFIFKSRPAYTDLTDGTPDLTLIYRLNRDFGSNEKLLAGQLVLQWNTWEEEVISVTH